MDNFRQFQGVVRATCPIRLASHTTCSLHLCFRINKCICLVPLSPLFSFLLHSLYRRYTLFTRRLCQVSTSSPWRWTKSILSGTPVATANFFDRSGTSMDVDDVVNKIFTCIYRKTKLYCIQVTLIRVDVLKHISNKLFALEEPTKIKLYTVYLLVLDRDKFVLFYLVLLLLTSYVRFISLYRTLYNTSMVNT